MFSGAEGGNIDYYLILFDCVCLVSLLCKEEFQELPHKTYFSSKWLTNSHAIVPDIWNYTAISNKDEIG